MQTQAKYRSMELPIPGPQTCGDAFDRIVSEHHNSVRRLVFRILGWRDGGDEVVQEVFLSAWAARSRLAKVARADLWLKRIAVNKCRSRLRREAVRTRWLGWLRASAPEEPHLAPDDPLVTEERASQVRRAIQSLSPRYREAMVLYYLEEMSVAEIAQIVGARPNAVEVRLHRARRRLEPLLADLAD